MSVFPATNAPCASLLRAVGRIAIPSSRSSLCATRFFTTTAPGSYSPISTLSSQQTWLRWRAVQGCHGLDLLNGHRRTIFTAAKVVRHYEDLPRDYRDQGGLAFSGRALSEAEIQKIFGSSFTAAAGNHLLRILHGRRVAGTLEDPAYAIHTAQFSDEQIANGLAYLRKNVSVNEVLNAGLRAEDELNQMDLEIEQKQAPHNLEEGADKGDVAAAEDDSVYGQSQFDRIRARNVAKSKAKEKALEEERLAAEAKEQAGVSGPLAKREDGQRAITNPKVAEYYEKAQSDLDAPPEMRTWERILPSATVVALVLGFLAAVSMVYEEPLPRYRLFQDISTAHATVGALIAANALVFLGWRIPPLWSLFNRYMIFVVATVRPVTLFTAVFSHTKFSHLVVNMIPLWFIGTALHEELGRAEFLTLYLGCGAMGFLGSLITYTLRGWLTVTSLGASGATLGLCSAYFWEHRNDGFKILGLPQDGVHGIVFLAMIAAVQLAGLGRTIKLKVDIASHLSGIVAGILGIELLSKRQSSKGQGKASQEAERKEVIEIWSPDASRVNGETGRRS